MSQPIRVLIGSLPQQIRAGLGRRVTAIFLALILEALLILMVLTLGWHNKEEEAERPRLVSFDASSEPEQPPAPSEDKPPEPKKAERPAPQSPALKKAQDKPQTEPASRPMISLSPDEMASADISPGPPRPAAPSAPKMGPPDMGTPGDTPRVGGAGPNGEPLYAAAWYREPYDDELRGYLSTATGPGWGLIACRTVPDFRVEDCVAVDEYPSGSNIARAVLAAAWQFRVRPPRVGGRSKVGEWVRIRIDYERQRR